MKKIIISIACAAMIIGLSACGGSENAKDAKDYKEPFGFLQATKSSPLVSSENSPIILAEFEKYFKKAETAKQKEILDNMMAGSNKKTATITTKNFFVGGWVRVVFRDPFADGIKLPILEDESHKWLSLYLSLKEFPEVAWPFEKYYIIIDKRGNVARLMPVPGTYKWSLEAPDDVARMHRGVLESGGEWSRAADRIEVPGSIDGVPKSVLDRRRDYWENLGKE